MARAMWKGVLNIGTAKLPVKLYAAVQDRAVHFRMLHAKDRQPVRQQMVNSETGDEVPKEEIAKAFFDEAGLIVKLEDEELEALEPEPSRDIEVLRFVGSDTIHHQWFDRPYYLGPDEGEADEYFALVEALKQEDVQGVARWVMRNKEYVGALRVRDDYLVLITLRHAGEVIDAKQLEAPGGGALDRKELALAEQLVATLEDTFDPAAFHDQFRERVEDLVEAKAKGRRPKIKRIRAKRQTTKSLENVLAASLASARKERKSA